MTPQKETVEADVQPTPFRLLVLMFCRARRNPER